ncbi:Mariner Mos1 transposase [Eumeta japonica]|uniref:Mariner Mos1 transposase n=1 Tax=Eumeta variegata TaxID=151549 RepID=A0A4C1ST76_EUMVA|nr:Mariner Mos1 transposase [Eumeta japonica]
MFPFLPQRALRSNVFSPPYTSHVPNTTPGSTPSPPLPPRRLQLSTAAMWSTSRHHGVAGLIAEVHRLLVEAYNKAALSEKTCREWFQKFENGDFDVEATDRSERPKIYEDAELEDLLEEDSSQIQKKLALTLEVTQKAVSRRLKSLGMIHKQDIAPSDYHLFRSMAHALSEQLFTSYEDTKNSIDSWIASRDKEFFRLGIRTLPKKWKKVVASDGKYFY